MVKAVNLNIPIDPELKTTVEAIFSRFGITVVDAVNIFFHKAIMVGGLPFNMTIPQYNEETLTATEEAKDIANEKIYSKSYTTLAELNAELDAEYDEEYVN